MDTKLNIFNGSSVRRTFCLISPSLQDTSFREWTEYTPKDLELFLGELDTVRREFRSPRDRENAHYLRVRAVVENGATVTFRAVLPAPRGHLVHPRQKSLAFYHGEIAISPVVNLFPVVMSSSVVTARFKTLCVHDTGVIEVRAS